MSDTPTDPSVVERFNARHGDAELLGEILWSSVTTPAEPVPLSHVKDVLDSVALGDFTPSPRSPADVFRTTSTDLFKTPRESADDGTTVKVTLKDVTTNPNEIVRRVVVEHRDGGAQRLYFGQTWDIRYNKEFHKIDLYPIDADAEGRITPRDRHADPRPGDDLVPEVRAAFQAHLHAVHADGLRTLITNVLRKAHGISVRNGGGVYFVPANRGTYVAALKAAAKLIPGMTISSVVMPFETEHVETLRGSIAAATLQDADELIADLQKAKRNDAGKIRASTLANHMARQKELKERLSNFAALLRDDLADSQTRLEMIDGLFASVIAGTTVES